MLQEQADEISADGGPDVIAEFKNNEEIKRKVIAGEMDFYGVAYAMNHRRPAAKRPPSPTRSPNGANGQSGGTIMSMTDKQFELLEKKVREGHTFRER
jgi:hypothetical protein